MTRQRTVSGILGAVALLAMLSDGGDALAQERIFFSSGAGGVQKIQSADLDGGNVQDVVTMQGAQQMDVDPVGGKIYWLVQIGGGQAIMRRANLDGTAVEDIWSAGVYQSFRIDAYDPAGAKIYFHLNHANRINRADLDGSNIEALVHFNEAGGISPVGLAIDTVNDRLYWTNTNGNIIQWTNRAGTLPVTTLPITGGTSIDAIDVDVNRGFIYWKDLDGIHRAGLDGQNPVLIVPPPEGQASAGVNNLRVDPIRNWLYWSIQGGGKIYRCPLGACIPVQIGQLTDTRNIALVLPCSDPFLVDSDADKVLDVCDNCVLSFNPAQGDFDGDGEGDRCDVNDGRLTLWYDQPFPGDTLSWDNEFGPFWNLYRGDLATLVATGVYSQLPGSHAAAARFCGVSGGTSLADGYLPGSGEIAFYLITGFDAGLETDLGMSTSGTRTHTNSCP